MSRANYKKFKITDKYEYDLDFKKPVETMDSSKLLTGDKIIAFHKERGICRSF